jgi:hypothetical protein
MVVKLGHDVRDGTFAAGTEWKPAVSEMWHWSYNDGASDHNPAVVSNETWAAFLKVWEDINAGNIDVEALLQ